jgi:transaldolase/glucose-6-phosphate isomerase
MTQRLTLGDAAPAVDRRLAQWRAGGATHRLHDGDYRLWTAEPQPEIIDRLGWLRLPDTMEDALGDIERFATEIRAEGFRDVVLLGMGGSSLAPDVFRQTFGSRDGYPALTVLDSTHPAAVRAVTDAVDPAATLFVVSSKSGTTIEPLSFFRHAWAVVSEATDEPGRHFVAITDPQSHLVDLAAEHGFRRVFEAIPDVGGRYSALTHFGLVPAALIGADVRLLLSRAADMAAAGSPGMPEDASPGFVLGAALGELAVAGRDKATFVMSPALDALPAWIEQLIAESTGKDGTGIVPIAGEPLGPPAVYGDDRVFVSVVLEGDEQPGDEAALAALEAAGHPVVRISVRSLESLGAEMYRFEVATAMAGSVLGIHPFDQPDVQRAKELAKQAMEGTLDAGSIPSTPAGDAERLGADLGGLFDTVRPGDYLALQAFVAPTEGAAATLERVRLVLRDRLRVATTVGFGPRFLHSTGQLHKGGPDTGVFVQVVDDPEPDLPIPGTGDTFGNLVSGQADGDFQALRDAGRRVLRLHLGGDPEAGLAALEAAVGD